MSYGGDDSEYLNITYIPDQAVRVDFFGLGNGENVFDTLDDALSAITDVDLSDAPEEIAVISDPTDGFEAYSDDELEDIASELSGACGCEFYLPDRY